VFFFIILVGVKAFDEALYCWTVCYRLEFESSQVLDYVWFSSIQAWTALLHLP